MCYCTTAILWVNIRSHLHAQMVMLQGEDSEAYEEKEREIKHIFKDLYINAQIQLCNFSFITHKDTKTHTYGMPLEDKPLSHQRVREMFNVCIWFLRKRALKADASVVTPDCFLLCPKDTEHKSYSIN